MTQPGQDADLQDIASAIFTSLSSLRADVGGGPFVSVEHYHGQNPSQDAQLAAAAAIEGTPSLMLAWAEEDFVEEPDVETLTDHGGVAVGTSLWRVFVAHRELAGYGEATMGQVDSPGLYRLVSLVQRKLLGLRVPGLYLGGRLSLKKSEPARVLPGQFISLVRVQARREVFAEDIPDTSVPFKGVDGDIGTDGVTDPDDGLVVPFSHRFE